MIAKLVNTFENLSETIKANFNSSRKNNLRKIDVFFTDECPLIYFGVYTGYSKPIAAIKKKQTVNNTSRIIKQKSSATDSKYDKKNGGKCL